MGIFDTAKRVATGRNYTFEDVRRAVEDPRRALSELNKLYTHFQVGQRYNPAGIDVFAEDWDTLVILDACRYDMFERHAELPGRTESRISRGSTSPEFVRGNYTGKTLHDVVYVSANGWYAKLKDDIGAEVHAFEFVERDAMDGITSRPETVAAAAREAAAEYPNKRLIVHFMQPHWPYLGPSGDRFAQGRFRDAVWNTDVTRDDVLEAYRENLDLVLAEVEPLLDEFDGRTVVTADHGELLGERERPIPVRNYEHPEGVYVESLVKVPWHIHESGERKEVVAERPSERADEFDFEQVERNLKDLGYRT